MKELWYDTLVFTLLKMLMGDGLLTFHHTLPKAKRNVINDHYRYHQLYPYQQTEMSCHRTGMVTLSTSSYSSITKALLEYSYGLSFNIEICRSLCPICGSPLTAFLLFCIFRISACAIQHHVSLPSHGVLLTVQI
jgi:hypothetical protein